MIVSAKWLPLWVQLFRRELDSRYLQSISGFAWVILHPLAILAIYAYVFVVIFGAKNPEAGSIGFVPYLALGFWPWTAFSESVLKSTNTLVENAQLIGKIAVPHWVLITATGTAPFILHMAGFAVILVILMATGTELHLLQLPFALILLFGVFVLSQALGVVLACLQVFARDVSQALAPVMTLWFFATPILYPVSLIPESVRPLMQANPMTYFVSRMRSVLLDGVWPFGWYDVIALTALILFVLFSRWLYCRCASRIEDFL